VIVQYKDDVIALSTHKDVIQRVKIFKTGVLVEDKEVFDGDEESEEWVLKFMRISRHSDLDSDRGSIIFKIKINDGSFYASTQVQYNDFSENKVDRMYTFSNSI
jgi:hypothetical protein